MCDHVVALTPQRPRTNIKTRQSCDIIKFIYQFTGVTRLLNELQYILHIHYVQLMFNKITSDNTDLVLYPVKSALMTCT